MHLNTVKHSCFSRAGTHLKYFSQKQDVILIRNLLASVTHRWEKIVSRCAERTRQLDHGYKEAKQVRVCVCVCVCVAFQVRVFVGHACVHGVFQLRLCVLSGGGGCWVFAQLPEAFSKSESVCLCVCVCVCMCVCFTLPFSL